MTGQNLNNLYPSRSPRFLVRDDFIYGDDVLFLDDSFVYSNDKISRLMIFIRLDEFNRLRCWMSVSTL